MNEIELLPESLCHITDDHHLVLLTVPAEVINGLEAVENDQWV